MASHAHTTAAPPALWQPFDRRGLLGLRSAVAAYAGELGAGDQLDDMVLVAHELSTNVVRHGGGHGELRLWRENDRLVCRVSDAGPGMPDAARLGCEPPTPYQSGGRGLWIVRRLTAVRIETGPDGTTVTAAMHLN